MFVDRAKIFIRSGKGGNGAVSFRREPFVPEGGPDGGDGGKGGDVIFEADENMRTLMDFRYKRKYEAENGQDGMKKKRYGKNGEDLITGNLSLQPRAAKAARAIRSMQPLRVRPRILQKRADLPKNEM